MQIHDKAFTVKNIKRGAKPIVELKRSITDEVKHVWRQSIQDIKDQWKSYDAKFEQEQRESGLATGHEQGVYIANNQPKTKDKLTANADKDELIDNLTEELLDEKQEGSEWKQKWKKQPYDIIDSRLERLSLLK